MRVQYQRLLSTYSKMHLVLLAPCSQSFNDFAVAAVQGVFPMISTSTHYSSFVNYVCISNCIFFALTIFPQSRVYSIENDATLIYSNAINFLKNSLGIQHAAGVGNSGLSNAKKYPHVF